MKRRDWGWAMAGGVLGAVLRALLGHWDNGFLPWGTLATNVLGTALLAVLYGRREQLGRAGWHFSGPGFCGGFTTVSGLNAQLLALLDQGRPEWAVAYGLGTLAAALPMVGLLLWRESARPGRSST